MKQLAEFRVINPAEEKIGTSGNKFTTQEVILAWSEIGDDGEPHEQRVLASLSQKSQEILASEGIMQGDVREVDLRFMTYTSKDNRVFNRVTVAPIPNPSPAGMKGVDSSVVAIHYMVSNPRY